MKIIVINNLASDRCSITLINKSSDRVAVSTAGSDEDGAKPKQKLDKR